MMARDNETKAAGSGEPSGQGVTLKARDCLVVFSGGQDSTTCLHWAIKTFRNVETIFFEYGQRHAGEKQAAMTIAKRLGVPLRSFRLDFFSEMGGNALVDSSLAIEAAPAAGALPNTFVPGRNLIFLTYAASYAYTRGIRDLVTGVCQTDYSGYPDCRNETIQSLEKALGLGLGWNDRIAESGGAGQSETGGHSQARESAAVNDHGGFRIHTPLMFMTKAASVRWAAELGALESLAFSHTCYEGTFPPCGKCPSCLLRKQGFAEAGVPDPLDMRAQDGAGKGGSK